MKPPNRDELRATLATFDERQKKIIGGVLALMFQSPDRVREREWILEQYTQVVLMAGGIDDISSTTEGVDRVQAYAREHVDALLDASYSLFVCVAEDLQAQDPSERSHQGAVLQALTYF